MMKSTKKMKSECIEVGWNECISESKRGVILKLIMKA